MKRPVTSIICFLLVFVFSYLSCSCSRNEALDISSADTLSIHALDTYNCYTSAETKANTSESTDVHIETTGISECDESSNVLETYCETEESHTYTKTSVVGEVAADTAAQTQQNEASQVSEPTERNYILNTNTKRFHYPTCSSVNQIKEKNKDSFTGTRDELISRGYKSCGNCHP